MRTSSLGMLLVRGLPAPAKSCGGPVRGVILRSSAPGLCGARITPLPPPKCLLRSFCGKYRKGIMLFSVYYFWVSRSCHGRPFYLFVIPECSYRESMRISSLGMLRVRGTWLHLRNAWLEFSCHLPIVGRVTRAVPRSNLRGRNKENPKVLDRE